MSTFARWETIDEMEIYGGRSALERISDLLFGVVLRGAQPPMEIRLIEVQPGIFFKGDDFTITAFPVFHRGSDSFGYLFQENPRRPFLAEQAEALNIPPGPWRRDLVNGQVTTLPDGRRILPEQVLGPERPGTRFVLVGDTGRTDNLVEYCRSADALVIEATYLEEEAEMARSFSHLTAQQAAQLAHKAGVRNLILTHLSRRYREREVLAEAEAVFPHVRVARDFDAYQVRREELMKVELNADEPRG
jgi:ribonuclease Z